ncbi:MAG: hypothetical protein IPK32_07710 [Verrucomicrobiaceae bacterium]|nr:hypothetical protein [Verrucomicrobiaceae bacterium]
MIERPLIYRTAIVAVMSLAFISQLAAQVKIDRVELPLNLEGVPGVQQPLGAAPAASGAAPATPPPLPAAGSATGAVAQLYLYVEPYQTRVEALFDMGQTFNWLSPDENPRPRTITAERQQQLIRDAEGLAAEWCSVETHSGKLPQAAPVAYFVKGKPGATVPMTENEELAYDQCMLGLVWQFTTNETPDEVNVTWKGWINELRELPVTMLFSNLSERAVANNITKRIQWQNKGRVRPAPLAAVPTFDPGQPTRIPVGLLAWLFAGAVFYWWIWHRDYRLPGGGLPYFGVWVFGLVLFGKLLTISVGGSSSVPRISTPEEAQKIVSPLLRNVYRAFDHRTESRVYDVLARSVDGELLRKLYLDTIQALTLDGREGTRVLITEFEASVDKATPNEQSGGFDAECNWSVLGNVGHWGHAHPRYNGYKARVTLTPIQGEWKLTALEVLEVRRK